MSTGETLLLSIVTYHYTYLPLHIYFCRFEYIIYTCERKHRQSLSGAWVFPKLCCRKSISVGRASANTQQQILPWFMLLGLHPKPTEKKQEGACVSSAVASHYYSWQDVKYFINIISFPAKFKSSNFTSYQLTWQNLGHRRFIQNLD